MTVHCYEWKTSSLLIYCIIYHVMPAQVVLTNCKVDIPRNSFSLEMYTLDCKHARMLLPVAEAQLDRMKPDMDA